MGGGLVIVNYEGIINVATDEEGRLGDFNPFTALQNDRCLCLSILIFLVARFTDHRQPTATG